MDLLEKKIITFGYITGRQNLTIAEKLSMLKFVKEASINQLNYLLKNGRMITESESNKDLTDIADQGPNFGKRTTNKDFEHIGKNMDDKTLHKFASKGDIWPADAAIRRTSVNRGLEQAKERAANRSNVDKAVDQAKDLKNQASSAVGGDLALAGIAAGSVAAITAGVLAYKRFFSKAARACKGMSGSLKTSCMKKFKADAKKAEISTLNSKKSICKGNPKCIAKIQARMQKAAAEEKELRSKV